MSILRILGVFTHQARLLRRKLRHCMWEWHSHEKKDFLKGVFQEIEEIGMEVEQRAHMTELKFHLSRGAVVANLQSHNQSPYFSLENQRRGTFLEPCGNVARL